MILQLTGGRILHTAYSNNNLGDPEGFSLDSQDGATYKGTYIDESTTESTNPEDYSWEELYNPDIDDTDDAGNYGTLTSEAELAALQSQITALQTRSQEMAEAITENQNNTSSAAGAAGQAQAIAEATGQHFWDDDSGAHVTEVTKEDFNDPESSSYQSGANTIWNTRGQLFRNGLNNLLAIIAAQTAGEETGVLIYDGAGNQSNNIIGSFTNNGIILGREDKTHLEMNSRALKQIDRDGVTYLFISDLRNEDGYIEQTETGDGSTYLYPTLMEINRLESATVDGVQVEAYAQTNAVYFQQAPPNGSEIIILYEPFPTEIAKAYTLGQRDDTAPIGPSSMVEGINNAASGARSHAEGVNNVIDDESKDAHAEGVNNTIANARAAHAEGIENHTGGAYSHVEGCFNSVTGEAAHAEGVGTVADGHGQHVGGLFNIPDTTSLEIIGNGANDNQRANIRTLSPTGKEWLADTLEVSRDPLTPNEVATKNYVDNSGGGSGGTSNYDQLSNRPKINGVTLTGNKTSADLEVVPESRKVNNKALDSDITLSASDVGALPDTTAIPTKTSDLTNDSKFISEDNLYFKPGDVYSVSYNHARALTGYVSSSTKGIYFEIPLPKFLTNVTGATITAMTGGVRGISGYVNNLTNNSNLKSGYTVTASVDNPNTLYVSVVSANTLTNVTNNTPISVALNSISITFS